MDTKKEIDKEKVLSIIDKFNRIIHKSNFEVHQDELDEFIRDGLILYEFL